MTEEELDVRLVVLVHFYTESVECLFVSGGPSRGLSVSSWYVFTLSSLSLNPFL